MYRKSTALTWGFVVALGILAGGGLLTVDSAGAAEAPVFQWTVAHGGTACLNLVMDTPPSGPRIYSTRQTLQESLADREVFFTDGPGTGIATGQRLQVVRDTGGVDHPVTGDSMGTLLEVLGVVDVVDADPTRLMVEVISSCRELEVGDYLRPLPEEDLPAGLPRLPVFDYKHLITPSDADAFLVLGAFESVVSDTAVKTRESVTQYGIYGSRDLVVIDQGSNAWQPADLATIYRDRVLDTTRRDVLQVPVILGRGMVVRADASTAIVQIIDSMQEIQIGDRMRKTGSAYDFVNNAPSIDCQIERSTVRTGESVRLTANVADPDGDPTNVRWNTSAGTLSAREGTAVTWTATNIDSGTASITATADDGRDEGTADCGVAVTISAAPGPTVSAGPGGSEVLDYACPEFPSGSTTIDNRCKAILDDVALQLRQNPRASAAIVGHADTSGDPAGNQRTSQERAENARVYLVETHGFDAARISVSGAGSAQPIADNDTVEGRLRNRRVEIRVTLPGQ